MKNYFIKIYTYHKRNIKLYLLLISLIYGVYFLNLKTPLNYILGDFEYWSKGLTRASMALFKLDISLAYKENPLIFLIIIIAFYYFFIEPITKK